MNSPFLSKHGELMAGLAAVIGPVLAFVLGMHIEGKFIYVNPGSSPLVWGIFSVSSAVYYFARSGGKTMAGGYTHPMFGLLLDIAKYIPLAALAFSGIREFGFVAQNGIWNDMVVVASDFLDKIVVLFLAASVGGGYNSLKKYFIDSKKE